MKSSNIVRELFSQIFTVQFKGWKQIKVIFDIFPIAESLCGDRRKKKLHKNLKAIFHQVTFTLLSFTAACFNFSDLLLHKLFPLQLCCFYPIIKLISSKCSIDLVIRVFVQTSGTPTQSTAH